MTALPIVAGDRSLELLTDAYRFIGRHADRLGTDGFRTRITGRRITCLRGADAARFFGEGGRFARAGAIPFTVRHLLQDDGSVQTVEGAEHAHRKGLFLAELGEAQQREMTALLDAAWLRHAEGVVDVHTHAVRLLGDAVLDWAGVPVEGDERHEVIAELQAMFENAGRFGARNALARARRRRTEARARRWIEDARRAGGTGTVLDRVAA